MVAEDEISHRTQAAAWHCDGMGHVNTRHIEAMFDDATAFYVGRLGADPRRLADEQVGWADRKHTFQFLAELRAGDLIEIRSRTVAVGTTSLTIAHRMLNASTGQLLAEAEIVSVCFNLLTRSARPLPEHVARLRSDLEA